MIPFHTNSRQHIALAEVITDEVAGYDLTDDDIVRGAVIAGAT